MAVLTGIALAGLALNAYGQFKQGAAAKQAGDAQRRAAESQADLLDFNATIADRQSADALERGRLDENRYRSSVRRLIGTQRTGFAGQGVEVSSGSAADVQADSAHLGELDALTIRQNAMLDAWGYRVEAYDTRQRAAIARREGVVLQEAGRAQQTAARIGAGASLLTGGASLLAARYGWGGTAPQTSTY